MSVDILILSNGPGEVTTWVRPVVKALRQQLGHDRAQVRISLVLSPCPNASGQEVAIAQSYAEIDRVQGADQFLPFLVWGKTDWDWRSQGVVVFLGGDQFFPVVIGKRLGYRTLIYGEWDTRWHRWIDRFGVMKPELIQQVHPKYAPKFTVVGDLMADIPAIASGASKQGANIELIGLLPGSKAAKLAQGVPLGLAIAHHIHQVRPQTRFVIPVAPTLSLEALARFANPIHNPILRQFGELTAELVQHNDQAHLQLYEQGQPIPLKIELSTRSQSVSEGESPAHELLAQCRLCFTTVGANTAELGALAVPMIVLLPTQQLDAMRAWDGLPGLLANLPGMGSLFARLINGWFLRQSRLLAWPNIWAGEAIVPELIGHLDAAEVAAIALDWLDDSAKLEQIQTRLRQVRGQPGAAHKLAQLVAQLVAE
jgi:lipid A disaccharide synthetase